MLTASASTSTFDGAGVLNPRGVALRAARYGLAHGLGYRSQHAAEDPLVKRIETVPVAQSRKPFGHEARELAELRFAIGERGDFEFEYGLSRKLHLC